jgi:hypothetical protein
MHHPEEPAVQFAKGAIVAGARSADHMPQFTCIVRYDVLLIPLSPGRRLCEVTMRLEPDLNAATKRSIFSSG